jgi:hypothetical protein
LHEVHRAIHYAFTNSYSSDICYPQFSTNHTGCLERYSTQRLYPIIASLYLTWNLSKIVKVLITLKTISGVQR